jgi:putative YphP/YqiW family bacilliredoxin
MPYDPALVQPMRDELTRVGVTELRTPAEVDDFMKRPGAKMVVVNSVCGCAAGGARPGVVLALRHGARPQHVATVFAGQDVEATARARTYFGGIPPSSPSIALFKDQALVHFVPRHMIEGRDGRTVAFDLVGAFEKNFGQPAAT